MMQIQEELNTQLSCGLTRTNQGHVYNQALCGDQEDGQGCVTHAASGQP